MRKIFYKIFIIGFLLSEILFAQNGGKIVGTVKDASTNDLLPGVNIIIEELLMGDASDEDGSFSILNVPPGDYEVKAKMLGYGTIVQKGVKVVSNLTTNVEFELSEQAFEVDEVTVVDFKIPPVQKDLTNKIQARTSEEISRIPITTVNDLLTQQAGIVKQVRTMPISSLPAFGQFATIPTDGLHFRGGRENETLYLFDGINIGDALWGGYNISQIGELAISSMETHSGTFGPKYGEAMSGVVSISSHDQISKTPKVSFKAFTDQLGMESQSQNSYGAEAFISASLPFYDKLGIVYAHRSYSSDGYINGFIYPEFVNSEGADKSGTPEKVPMQYNDTQFDLAKIIWQPITELKITLGGYLAKANNGVYDHYFKYNPYGVPRVKLDDDLAYMKANYIISQNSFLVLSLSNYNRGFISRVYENPAYYDILPQTGNGEFSVTGEDWVFFKTNFGRKSVGLDYVWQINKIHNLAVGVGYEALQTDLERRNPDGGVALEEYKYKPIQMNGYVNEKMEFDEMGMIVNLGARFDYVDSKRKVLVNLANLTDLTAPLEDAKAEFYVTPRLGISFPVAEKAALRFGYGHYYQFPNYFKVFQGSYYLASTGEYRPNPQLENTPIASKEVLPEKTVNYEFGLQTMFSQNVSADITGFYRKTSNLIGVLLSETTEGKRFQELTNIDYATVKGVEFSVKKHFTDNFSAFFNYTYSNTLVSTSILFSQATDEARTFPANWDQPHSFRGNIYFEFSSGFGFSLYGSYSSGYPYTRSQFDPNGERSPWIHELDINLFKNFELFGFKEQAYIQILNLTNDKNVWWVYADSGIPGDDASEATSHDYTNNPSMYGPGRTIQIGLKLWN
ncbi:MAG: TonB-dependent receptor [Ignavibacteriae bacterium]|nr:TonB-dependent receptor [Ignavibacteriota bacterium]MCB0742266.1 TonB-dependent receptor [Ignavibacteriota bacterium]MCB0745840.1 TonB-dependent receptor [Ignavibacteriota bacterium]MCB0750135.1 TonB-dependent receptor [Ignavibacteriota bacterium]MCB9247723.1 TonB-dependent receptor [Ignavibacteriales bacterium]